MTRAPHTGLTLRWRLALVALAALALWGAVATWVVPALIGAAYAGESLPVFNRMISGQSRHPLATYLSAWRSTALAGTAALVLLAAVLVTAAPHLHRLRGALRWLRPDGLASLPRPTAADVLLMAASIGIVGGLAEASRAVWRQRVAFFPTGEFTSPEAFWMAPLAAATTLLGLGALLIAADRLARAEGTVLRLAPLAFTAIAGFSFLRGARLGIANYSAWLLAFGVAALVTRTIAARPALTRRILRVGVPVMVAVLAAWAMGIPVWRRAEGARALAALPTARPDAPNVLIVIWDTARALSLSLHGYHRQTTPELDRFARAGTVFERAIATAPWTLPSHASMYTGRYPTELSAARQLPLDDAHPTLAEVLAREGYATGAFMANIYYGSSAFGLARGFAWYDDRPPIDARVIAGTWWVSYWIRWQLRDRVGENGPSALRPRASHVNGSLLQWIDDRGGRPFFAVVNHLDAHDPYFPPPPFNRAFSPPFTAPQPRYWLDDRHRPYTADELRQLTDAYDGAIRYLDHELGRLLEALRERGVLDNTVVIVTSDHGEEFGEHHPALVKHARSLYAQALHVPLVIVAPSRMPAGVRRSEPVSIRDIPATVMELLGLAGESPFPGTSLLRYANGSVTPAERTEARLSVGESSPLGGVLESWPIAAGDMFSLVSGDLHYIVDGKGREELYDLSADPHERNDLASAAESAPHLARFRATLDSLAPLSEGVRRAFLPRGSGASGATR